MTKFGRVVIAASLTLAGCASGPSARSVSAANIARLAHTACVAVLSDPNADPALTALLKNRTVQAACADTEVAAEFIDLMGRLKY